MRSVVWAVEAVLLQWWIDQWFQAHCVCVFVQVQWKRLSCLIWPCQPTAEAPTGTQQRYDDEGRSFWQENCSFDLLIVSHYTVWFSCNTDCFVSHHSLVQGCRWTRQSCIPLHSNLVTCSIFGCVSQVQKLWNIYCFIGFVCIKKASSDL